MSRAGNSHSRSKPSLLMEEHTKVQNHLTKATNKPYNNTEVDELKQQVSHLKKQLKEAHMKRNLVIKQLSDVMKKNESLESEVTNVHRKSKQKADRSSAQEYKVQQLHFLNRELNNEIESMRSENEKLVGQLKQSTSLLENKYQDLERNTLSKIELAVKRIKKTVGYLSTLSGKELEKTRNSLVENLQKSLDLLREKYVKDELEDQVDEMMSPLNVLKDELTHKDRDLRQLKEKVEQLEQHLMNERKINRDIIPQYKSAVEKLKRNLQLCRARIAQFESQKQTTKQTYEARMKELEKNNRELSTNLTRIALENRVYQGKLEQLQGEVQEEKDMLVDQNHLLKKLYNSHESSPACSNSLFPVTETTPLQSSRSSAQLSQSRSMNRDSRNIYEAPKLSRFNKKLQEVSYSRDIHSDIDLSQATLKDEINMVDQEIAEIQRNLAKELEAYNADS